MKVSKGRFFAGLSLLLFLMHFGGITLSAQSAQLRPAIPGEPVFAGDWVLLGPFANPVLNGVCTGFRQDFLAGEATAQVQAGQAQAGRVWKSWHTETGLIDFIQAFGQVQDVVAYAWHEFKSNSTRNAVIKVGSDDGIRMWLNGELILDHHIHRAISVDEDAIIVHLQAGTNRLLVKVDQGSGGWEFLPHLYSLEQDRLAAAKHPPVSLQVIPEDSVVSASLSGMVQSLPAYGLPDVVQIRANDEQGRPLVETNSRVGSRFSLTLPADFHGPVVLQAVGRGILGSVATIETRVWVGNPYLGLRRLLAQARGLAIRETLASLSRPSADATAGLVASVPAASLLFLADQVDGRGHPSLISAERKLRALFELRELLDSAGRTALATSIFRPGLHQYAYRSALDNSIQPFSLWIPPRGQVGRPGLVMALHGYSGNDWDAAYLPAAARPNDFVIAGAFGRGDMGYQALGERDVLDVLDLVSRACSTDPDRVVLTGNSMGGMGTWRLGQLYAGRFAGIAPFCGWTVADWLPNLRTTPALVVHGDADTVVPPAADRAAVTWLQDAAYPVHYDELPGAGHNVWAAWIAIDGPNRFFAWARTLRRQAWPDHLTITTNHLRYGSNRWASLTELGTPLQAGSLDLVIVDERHLSITTSGVAGFSLDLHHPKLAYKGRILLIIDGRSLAVDAAARTVRIFRDSSGHFQERSGFSKTGTTLVAAPELIHHDGGGLADLFYRPLYVVYGTQAADKGAALKVQAALLADFSLTPGAQAGSKIGSFRIIPDTALTPAIIATYSLLLVGGPGENQVTARLSEQLPVQFSGDGSVRLNNQSHGKAGVALVMPNPENPRQLLGLLSLPFGDADARSDCVMLNQAVRRYGVELDDTASFILPDIVLFGRNFQASWMANFDADWKLVTPDGLR